MSDPSGAVISGAKVSITNAVVMALTATATPIVQDDISQQLGLIQPARFIHGFGATTLRLR